MVAVMVMVMVSVVMVLVVNPGHSVCPRGSAVTRRPEKAAYTQIVVLPPSRPWYNLYYIPNSSWMREATSRGELRQSLSPPLVPLALCVRLLPILRRRAVWPFSGLPHVPSGVPSVRRLRAFVVLPVCVAARETASVQSPFSPAAPPQVPRSWSRGRDRSETGVRMRSCVYLWYARDASDRRRRVQMACRQTPVFVVCERFLGPVFQLLRDDP